MKFRTQHNFDRDESSMSTGLACTDMTRTKQQHLEDTNLNNLLRKFGVTGTLPMAVVPPTYADYAETFDYQSAQNTLLKAEASFMALSSGVRKQFDNDPQKFFEFCTEEKDGVLTNLEEMRKMGLAIPKATVDNPPTT